MYEYSSETQSDLVGDAANVQTADVPSFTDTLPDGRQVVIGVNAGGLWSGSRYYENGQANHVITVTTVVRDQQTGEVIGVIVNDSVEDWGKVMPPPRSRCAWCACPHTSPVRRSSAGRCSTFDRSTRARVGIRWAKPTTPRPGKARWLGARCSTVS